MHNKPLQLMTLERLETVQLNSRIAQTPLELDTLILNHKRVLNCYTTFVLLSQMKA